MPATDSNFGPRLKELRTAAGLTQEQLADKAGVSLGTIRALEQCSYDPTWPTTQALARALGADCTAFTVAAKTAERKAGRPKKAGKKKK